MQRTASLMARLTLAAFFALAAGSSPAQTNPEKPFVSGGRIEMTLEGGDYEVRPGADNRVRVTLSGNIGSAKAAVNTNGTHADIEVTNTPHNNFHAIIEVPEVSDLRIRLTAGNLVTGAIKGNKDIQSNAGNAEITVGDPSQYASVDASVRAGNIDADVFGSSTSGLFRSFKWQGKGKYAVRARLGAGNLGFHK
ncbi:MAG TPA: hypothetical protein VN176_14715 [Verrucomicrobiae bacterium]|jgi:hypothetical protein|nr:hypothetical protein [Verrucomicrobiae bacterium]